VTAFPGSPRLIKGAIVGLDLKSPLASIIVFQYNPDTMTRRLDARSKGGEYWDDRSEAFRLTGPPRENITLSIELDAADQLEEAHPLAVATGISPTLSALEMLIYPKSYDVIKGALLANGGFIEIKQPEAPLTLFIWGPTRVLPVRVTSISITEEAYDTLLNPIRAKVDLSLYVLSYADLKANHAGYYLFLVHQITKELMASTNVINSVGNIGASLKLF
jgi:hypothetical protein